MEIIGLAGVISGHPFDTVKVRLQNDQGHAAYRTTLQTFKTIIKEESVLWSCIFSSCIYRRWDYLKE
jgi:hypothetical protein